MPGVLKLLATRSEYPYASIPAYAGMTGTWPSDADTNPGNTTKALTMPLCRFLQTP